MDNYTAKWGSTRIRRIKGNPLKLFQLIVSKILVEKIEVNPEIIYNCQLDCEEWIVRNPFEYNLRTKMFIIITKNWEIAKPLTLHQRREMKKFLGHFKSYLLNPRSLGSEGWKEMSRKIVDLKMYYKLHKSRYPKLESPAHIGVGYKDKGSMKNLANDGSLNWEDIATCLYRLPKSFRSKVPLPIRRYLTKDLPNKLSVERNQRKRLRKERSILF